MSKPTEEDDKLIAAEVKVQQAFGVNPVDWYCQAFKLADIDRIKTVKPETYRKLVMFLEPFADKLLGKKRGRRKT